VSLKFSEEQEELRHTLNRFFEENVDSEYLRKRIDLEQDSDPELWNKFRELGLLEYFASKDPELKPSFRELAIVAFEAGASLVPETLGDVIFYGPYLLSHLVAEKDSEQIKSCFGEDLLTRCAAGDARAAFSRFPDDIKITTKAGASLVSGTLSYVAGGGSANIVVFMSEIDNSLKLILCADSEFPARGSDLVDTKACIEPTLEPSLDGTIKRHTLQLHKAPCIVLNEIDLDQLEAHENLLRANELSGLCAKVVRMTVDYVKTRKQFGVVVGSFQAVQHRLADMHVAAESLRSLVNFASWAADDSKEQFVFAAKAAIGHACNSATSVVEGAIQLHGGIGFTWEHDLHLYLRRAKTIEALYSLSDFDYKDLIKLAV